LGLIFAAGCGTKGVAHQEKSAFSGTFFPAAGGLQALHLSSAGGSQFCDPPWNQIQKGGRRDEAI